MRGNCMLYKCAPYRCKREMSPMWFKPTTVTYDELGVPRYPEIYLSFIIPRSGIQLLFLGSTSPPSSSLNQIHHDHHERVEVCILNPTTHLSAVSSNGGTTRYELDILKASLTSGRCFYSTQTGRLCGKAERSTQGSTAPDRHVSVDRLTRCYKQWEKRSLVTALDYPRLFHC